MSKRPRLSITASNANYPAPVALGRHNVVERIQSTEVADLYRCVAPDGTATVAQLVSMAFEGDDAFCERFIQRAYKCRELQLTPAIVEIGRLQRRPYLVREYIDGRDLRTWLRHPLSIRDAHEWLKQIAAALKNAHAGDLIHGDLHPGHIVIADDNLKAHVVGFGLTPPWRSAEATMIHCAPSIMAPELASGAPVSVASDIYAFGCLLFETFVGRPAFSAASANALLACHTHEPFPLLCKVRSDVPPAFEKLMQDLVRKDPRARPKTMGDVLVALEAIDTINDDEFSAPLFLKVVFGRERGVSYRIPQGEFLIGRIQDRGICVDDVRVSRNHAMLILDGDQLFIRDLESRNGVFVNQKRIVSDTSLVAGDEIQVGDTRLLLAQQEGTIVTQTPKRPARRGAFQAIEIVRTRTQRAESQAFATADTLQHQRNLIADMAQLFLGSDDTFENLEPSFCETLRRNIAADDVVIVPLDSGVPDFSGAAEKAKGAAEILAKAIPAALSIATTIALADAKSLNVAMVPLESHQKGTYVVALSNTKALGKDALWSLEKAVDLASKRIALFSKLREESR